MSVHNKTIHNKIKTKHIIAMIISLAIMLIVAINIYKINFDIEEGKYPAEEGILDLQSWNMLDDKIIDLHGQWEFYSGVLIQPSEDFNQYQKQYVDVPGTWESYLKDDGLKNGSGTYRLTIKVPKDDLYGIKAKTIRLANRIYLNGEEATNAGNPSVDRKHFESESKYNIGAGNSLNKEIELIVHVTSLDFRSGGIIRPIELGLLKSIITKSNKALALDALVVSICLFLALYFLVIYFQRNKGYYLAYFSGSNFFMAIYLSTMNEQILRLMFDYNHLTRYKIQIFTMIMVTICFLRFIHYFFIDYSNKKSINIITGLLLSTLLFIFNNPSNQRSLLIGTIQNIVTIFMLVAYTYIFYILIKAIYKKANSLGYVFVISASMLSYWILLILKTFWEIDMRNLPVMLISLIMLGVAALMSDRLQLDFQEANDLSEKLIRDDSLKDEFLVKASHGLKIPLQAIVNATRSLLEGEKGSMNIKQQEGLFLIDHEAKRLVRLTDNLQDASLIKQGKIKLRLTSVDSYTIVEDILEEIKMLVPYNEGIKLKNLIPKDFPALKADLDKFRQIIYEITHNAIKYTRFGEIVISGSVVNEQAKIQIKDTGMGIKEKYIEEVFDIFYQNNHEDGLNQGLGLGLSIVKQLVEIQNGKIELDSIYGKGTIFKITLPLFDTSKEEVITNDDEIIRSTYLELSSTIDGEKHRQLDNPTILIIDDEKLNQKILTDILNELKYNIIIANSGKESLNIIKNKKIDLIILDFILPDMTGGQLCNMIREEYSIIELPILILTASRRAMDFISAFDYGANDFQRKPIDPEELKSRIQSLLLIKISAEQSLEKEFQYFYSQISPHFLYNTLNSIIGLSYKDSDKTRKALNNLSIYFRGKLDIHREKGLVSLESELELIRAYLEIEEMRYGERLEIEYDIEEGLNALIPPLTLQPIVENSVHHGTAQKDSGGKVKVIAKNESNGFISITIEDNGKGMTLEKQEELLTGDNKGIGFKNVMERIKILKGAKLTLESKIGEGTKVKIIIPEVKNHENYFS